MKTKLKVESPFISIRKSLTTVFTNNNWPTAQYNKGVYQAQVVQKVDSSIQLLNNRGQEYIRSRLMDAKFVKKRMNTNAVSF